MNRRTITHKPDPKLDLVLERVVDVPPNLVWAVWTTPEYVKQWFTPAPWRTVDCEIDLRPGGVFRTVMRSPEGQEFPNVGSTTSRRLSNVVQSGAENDGSREGQFGKSRVDWRGSHHRCRPHRLLRDPSTQARPRYVHRSGQRCKDPQTCQICAGGYY